MLIRKQPKPRNVHLPSNWYRDQRAGNHMVEQTPKYSVQEMADKLLRPTPKKRDDLQASD